MTKGPLPTSCCPSCLYEMDCATCATREEVQPSAGDLSICLNCGEILQFNDILVLKPVAKGVLESLEPSKIALLQVVSERIKQRGLLHDN